MNRYAFGAWKPDLSAILNKDGTTVATNVIPEVGGFRAARGIADVSMGTLASTALDVSGVNCVGAIGGIISSQSTFNFAGDREKLYGAKISESSMASDVSRDSGYALSSIDRWNFIQYGDAVVAMTPPEPLQVFDFEASATTFDDLSEDAPRGGCLAVVGSHLVVGDYVDDIVGPKGNGIRWSALGNVSSWPVPGTDLAISVQSDRQTFDVGGRVKGIASGAEVAAIFCETSIYRMDYRGGDIIYQFTRVDTERGLLASNAFSMAGPRAVFYLSEEGFYLFDFVQSSPIGKNVINNTFFEDFNASYKHLITCKSDPNSTKVYFSYPSNSLSVADLDSGVCDKIIVYDWALNQFSILEISTTTLCLVSEVNTDIYLDYPNTDEELQESGLGELSFDDDVSNSFDRRLGAYSIGRKLSDFSGAYLDATIETGDIEPNVGARSTVVAVRPIVDGEEPTIQLSSRKNQKEDVKYSNERRVDSSGKCNLRQNGRFHRVRANFKGGFTQAFGCDVDARSSGNR